ncbi:hypothetical protein KGQ20_42455, partial [Catenulispora sp. NF23]
MGSTDDTSGGGFTKGPDDSVYGNPNSPGSVSDYAGWDWHQIEAAIMGGTSLENADDVSRAGGISNPQTLVTAANSFFQVQQALQMVAQVLHDQSHALAGDDQPWKGPAADAFLTMMDKFQQEVSANATRLTGGSYGDQPGGHSIVRQLVDNANYLNWAQVQIQAINHYYAQAALNMRPPASVVDGLVQIHEKPVIVQMITSDMRHVLTTLAGDYQVTIDNTPKIDSNTSNMPPPPPNADNPPPPDQNDS